LAHLSQGLFRRQAAHKAGVGQPAGVEGSEDLLKVDPHRFRIDRGDLIGAAVMGLVDHVAKRRAGAERGQFDELLEGLFVEGTLAPIAGVGDPPQKVIQRRVAQDRRVRRQQIPHLDLDADADWVHEVARQADVVGILGPKVAARAHLVGDRCQADGALAGRDCGKFPDRRAGPRRR